MSISLLAIVVFSTNSTNNISLYDNSLGNAAAQAISTALSTNKALKKLE